MRPILIISVLLAVAVLFATTPVLAAGDLELRILEGPFTVAPTASASTAPAIFVTGNPAYDSSDPVNVLDDHAVR